MRKTRAACLALLMLLAAAVQPPAAGAADASPRAPEYLLKAAYLYNFAMFVEWPATAFETPESPLVIGIVGADPFGWAIDRTVQDKRINRRRIVVERLQWNQDAKHCHIVFFGGDAARVTELAERLEGMPTLLVSDLDGPRLPSAINFVVRDNKVGFMINLERARRARLEISSKLLNLARVVR